MKTSAMKTERLILTELSLTDADFIFELLNTPSWIRFIGNKNIATKKEAEAYIRKIQQTPASNYWVVRLQETTIPIGVVTFMKRDYLEDHDIGFAFLDQFGKRGYAYEASKRLLDEVKPHHKKIGGTVLQDNTNSIQLLKKLGLEFEKEILINNEPVLLYSILIQH
jgi:ribosomal-protein-alanine N-acetyltransferase